MRLRRTTQVLVYKVSRLYINFVEFLNRILRTIAQIMIMTFKPGYQGQDRKPIIAL